MADVHGFGRPNLLSRLYLRLESIGVASRIYYVLDLAERIDPLALQRALAGLLEDWPQLRSRPVRHWYGYRRTLVPQADVNLDTVLTVSADAAAADVFLQHTPNLVQGLPVQVLLHQGATHDQIVMALDHSLADGRALMVVLARLGEHYGAILTGTPPPPQPAPAPEARYRHLLRSLSWPDRVKAFRQAFRYLWDGAQWPGAHRLPALATFIDAPLPAQGELRYTRLALDVDQPARLIRWAVKRNGSLTDVLLTASLRAALTVWPDQAALPILVTLPVNVRTAGSLEVANLVGVMDFTVRAGDFERIFTQVSAATARARTLRPAVVNLFQFAAASCLPPAIFDRLARRYFSQTVNVRESLTFTAISAFEGGPQRFGPVPVTDSVLLGSLVAPPGLKVHMSRHGGRLNLCVAYLDPVIAPASIAAFTAAVRAELGALT
jgi:NRPS condensation-like uncharacterized protein